MRGPPNSENAVKKPKVKPARKSAAAASGKRERAPARYTVYIGVKLDPPLVERIDAGAARARVSRAEFIRNTLNEALS